MSRIRRSAKSIRAALVSFWAVDRDIQSEKLVGTRRSYTF